MTSNNAFMPFAHKIVSFKWVFGYRTNGNNHKTASSSSCCAGRLEDIIFENRYISPSHIQNDILFSF